MIEQNGSGLRVSGSLLIAEAVDLKTLQTVLAEDPYARAGLFESVDIKPWKWVIGAPG